MYRIRPSWQVRLSWLVAPVVVLGLFAGTFAGADRLAFRDVSHFYTPLYEYVGARSRGEWLPVWNPLDQTGIPLLGETTTAFFYPIRYLLFALPLPASTAMGGYVAVHLVIAALAAALAAHWAGASRCAAAIAGVSYPLSGSLVGLYLNPPFLVGAAWLPLAAGALLGQRPVAAPVRALIAGMALALMILGGDPQTALHVTLIAVATWLVGVVRRLWRPPGPASALGSVGELVLRAQAISRWALAPAFHNAEKPRANTRRLRKTAAPEPNPAGFPAPGPPANALATAVPKLVTLLAAALIATALSLPQFVASMSWSGHSERLEAERATAWWQPPATGSQRHQAYQFSLPPWHLAGLLTPTPWGTLLPEYRQLSALVPGDGRIWTFSIYPGLLATLALVCRVASWRRDGLDRWSLIAVIALLLSMGHFGLVWWLQNMTGLLGQFDSAIGGVYWVLYHTVPGYDLFRYPAKWLPVFSLAVSIVAAKWCDRAAWRSPSSSRWIYGGLLIVVVLGCGAVSLAQERPDWIAPPPDLLPADRFWGPLDVVGGLREIRFSLFHSLAVLAALGVVLFIDPMRRWPSMRRWLSMRRAPQRTVTMLLLVAVAAIDLTLAAIGWVHTVDVEREEKLAEQITPTAETRRWLRTQSGGGWPATWRDDRSGRRLMEVEASQRAAWMGRWHLAERQAVFNSMTSIQSHEMASFWQATARATGGMSDQQQQEFWRAVRRWLAIGGESHTTGRALRVPIVPSTDASDATGERANEAGYELVDIHRLEHVEPPSVIRFHQRWRVIPQADEAGASKHWARLLSDVARRAEATVPRVTDARPVAVSAPQRRRSAAEPDAAAASDMSVRVTDQSPDRLELTVSVRSDGLLSRRVYQDGHWVAWVRPVGSQQWRRSPVYCVDFLAQGIWLPAGHWAVRFDYQPAWLRPALATGLVGWIGALAALWWLTGRGTGRRSVFRTVFRMPVRWRG